ncbi:hypothetical protein cypCar_00029479 [Cyprinus carpio]|nr:hypothetical protein cypCar_00029479 [Cyprinus carpio]
MIEEGSKSSKSMVEKRQLFMEMSELLSDLTTLSAQCTTHIHRGLYSPFTATGQ